jgi:hypothetical protein
VLGGATERKRKFCDQPFGIRNKKKKKSMDGDTEGEWTGS